MSTAIPTNINSKEICPTYNFYFYANDGQKIADKYNPEKDRQIFHNAIHGVATRF